MIQAVVSLIWDGVGRFSRTLGLKRFSAVTVAEPLGSVAAGAVTVGEIAALNHEVVDDAVEDGPVIVAVFHEEFEVLNVNRCGVRVEFDGHGSAVGTAVPRELQVNDVGGGVGPVGDIDHRQDQHTGQENGHDTRRRWRAVVEQARERGLTDALVLHLVEQVVVETVGFLVPRVLFGGLS